MEKVRICQGMLARVAGQFDYGEKTKGFGVVQGLESESIRTPLSQKVLSVGEHSHLTTMQRRVLRLRS